MEWVEYFFHILILAIFVTSINLKAVNVNFKKNVTSITYSKWKLVISMPLISFKLKKEQFICFITMFNIHYSFRIVQ